MITIEEASKLHRIATSFYICELDIYLSKNILETIEKSAENSFKLGAEFAQRWIPVEEEKPLAYETGEWDGKRSNFVLAKDKHGNVYIARIYQGVIDGSEFCDFVDRTEYDLNDIISWRPINLK